MSKQPSPAQDVTPERRTPSQRINWFMVGAYLLVVACLYITVWEELDDYARGVVTMVIGACIGWIGKIFEFEYGATRAGRAKDETISALTKKT